MKFKSFLKENVVVKTGNSTYYSNYINHYKKIDSDGMRAVRSVFSEKSLEKDIKSHLKQDGEYVHLKNGSVRVYGTHKEGDEVIVYLQCVVYGEMDEDYIDQYSDDFKIGDIYYTNWCVIASLNTGKVLDAMREDDNSLHTSYKAAYNNLIGEKI